MTTQTLTIDFMVRANSSTNGNPAWNVTFTNGLTARTQSDAGISYALDNPEYRAVPLIVEFTKAGRIATVKVA